MQPPKRLKIFVVAVSMIAAPALAYQIGSSIPGKEYLNLHETFTAVAGECLRDQGWPSDCSASLRVANDRATKHRGQPDSSFEYGSRWPDDPTRMLDAVPSTIRFGGHFLRDCQSALARGPAINRVGLLCASHFGRLQFMHAQASSDDAAEGTPGTRRKIIEWAMFAYRAATDRNFRDANYCQAIAAIPEPGLRAALTFSDDTLCRPRPQTFLGLFRIGSYPSWTVRTLFTLRCPNPTQELVCWERSGDASDELARAAAVGAILHLVQDSFSQSHVARVPDGESAPGARGPFRARVVCRRASLYYDYEAQNRETPDDTGEMPDDPHAVADFPAELHPSCRERNRPVDDVVTASTAVLYFVGLQRPDAAGFRRYLEAHVFPA